MTTPCSPIDNSTRLGSFEQYRTNLAPCAAPQIGKPLFFGRRPAPQDEPLFVALDFEQYEIARKSMILATTAAAALGIALVVVLLKNRGRSSFY